MKNNNTAQTPPPYRMLQKHAHALKAQHAELLAALREIYALDLRHPDAGIYAANIAERALRRITD